MSRRTAALVLAFLSCIPSGANASKVIRQGHEGLDFWQGTGRIAAVGIPQQVDLSGEYKVDGTNHDSSTYESALTVRKWKTLTTPQGAKFNTYHLTWTTGDEKVEGIGMTLGSRLYVAYGSENLMLGVAAPFELTAEERPAYDQYAKLARRIEGKQDRYSIKNAPWFAECYNSFLSPGEYPSPEYYELWINAKGNFGDTFIVQMKGDTLEWANHRYFAEGNWRKDNGEVDYSGSELPLHWHVRDIGRNFNIHCRDTDTYQKDVHSKSDVDGASFELDDGTVVMILGGSKGCGYGYFEPKGDQLVGPFAGEFSGKRGSEVLTKK
jgi:hypothetical protein